MLFSVSAAIRQLICAAAVVGVLQAPVFSADATVRLNGAPPVAQPVVKNQAAIETASGAKLVVTPTNNPKGLEALRAGEADLALLAPSLKKVVEAMNAANPGSANAEGLQEFTVGEGSISLIVHPGNAVATLTVQQARDIFSGKIANWKEVGGADKPITVIVLDPTLIPRIVIDDQIMAGTPVAKGFTERNKPTEVVANVAANPDAISFTGTALVDATVKAIKLDQPLRFPMIFVAKGEPSAPAKAVIEAAKTTLGKK